MAVQDKITEIIVEQLGVKAEEVTPEASFVDEYIDARSWRKLVRNSRGQWSRCWGLM